MQSVTTPARWRVYAWNPATSTVLHSLTNLTFQNKTLLCCPILGLPFQDKSKLFCTPTCSFEVKSAGQDNGRESLVSSLCCSSYPHRYSILLLLPYDTCLTSHDPWIIYNHTTSPDESAHSALWVGYSRLRYSGTEDEEEEESIQIQCKGLWFLALCVCVLVQLLATEKVTAHIRWGFEAAASGTWKEAKKWEEWEDEGGVQGMKQLHT